VIWALLAAYLTKRPPWIQAVVFGLCVGLFVAAADHANDREPVLSTVVIQVLAFAAVVGGPFYLGLRSHTAVADPPTWVDVAYAAAWVLALVAALLALFGEGGLKVAVLAIVPIVLLAPPALVGIRMLIERRGHPGPPPSDPAGRKAAPHVHEEPTT
jgi:hypothetical protein